MPVDHLLWWFDFSGSPGGRHGRRRRRRLEPDGSLGRHGAAYPSPRLEPTIAGGRAGGIERRPGDSPGPRSPRAAADVRGDCRGVLARAHAQDPFPAAGLRLARNGLPAERGHRSARAEPRGAPAAGADRPGEDADPRLPESRLHLAQGWRRQDEHLPARRPHLRHVPGRSGRRPRRQPGRGNARSPDPARDLRDRHAAARRSERIERYADIRAYTSQAATRLEVVAADDDPQVTEAIGEAEFERAIRLLERHYNLVCLDTGTGVLESATRGILDAADQIVVVSAPSLDGARAASSTLDWLEENGYSRLVEGAVAVLNAVRPVRGLVDLER